MNIAKYFQEHLFWRKSAYSCFWSDVRKRLFRTFFLDSCFQKHSELLILQKTQLLWNQSFKQNLTHMTSQCWTESIFGDTVYLCYCKFRLVTPPWWGLRGQKNFILTTLDHWKRHFREQNYMKNYFYLLKSTNSTKTTSQRCWRNIIWTDFFGHPYQSNGIKTRLGLPVPL